jgi:hypothetical protein
LPIGLQISGAPFVEATVLALALTMLRNIVRVLRRNGIFVMVGGGFARILQAASLGPLLSRVGSKKIRFFIAKISTKIWFF